MGKKGRKTLKFDLPYTSEPPLLVSQAIGFSRLIERKAASHDMDVTILDSPDHRLLRAGVVVAHRVVQGLGEWYLSAASWEPWLPGEFTQHLGATAELPESIAQRIRPLLRRAPIGPVAAMHCVRSSYGLRDADGHVQAEIRDEKVTIRRGGVATARYRELTVAPAVSFTPQQREFILTSMEAVSATPVAHFPSLQQRLGPPATGLTDFPQETSLRKRGSMEDFVTAVFAANLRDLTESLLAFAVAEAPNAASLQAHLEQVGRDVRGLAAVLEPEWRRGVEEATVSIEDESANSVAERALDVVDALVGAVRAPHVGDEAQAPAREFLYRRAERAAIILGDRCRALQPDSRPEAWSAALQTADQLYSTAAVAGRVFGKSVKHLARHLRQTRDTLEVCAVAEEDVDLDGLDAAAAFRLGQFVEKRRARLRSQRERFVASWPHDADHMKALLDKVRKKL